MMNTGPRNLITDVPGLRVGNAEDHALKSGTTVLLGETPFTAAVHVMGGAPGTRETDLLEPDKIVGAVNALVLSGGSSFGLDAASGVTDALAADGHGFAVGAARVPIVPAAILFDLLNGGDKGWEINPYRALGEAAYRNVGEVFSLGSHGAGTGAIMGTLKGGLGSASVVLASGVTVGALVAGNALGCATVGDDPNFWAAPFEIGDEFGGLGLSTTVPEDTFCTKFSGMANGANTTIAIVATDAALSKAEAKRIATAAHDGMARAIVPSHTPFDGDLVFSVATGARLLREGPPSEILQIGHAAALCLSRAIARAAYEAHSVASDTVSTWRSKFES